MDICSSLEHLDWVAVICGSFVHVLDVHTGKIERALDCASQVLTLAVEKRSCSQLAVSTSTSQIQTWDIQLAKNIRTWKSATPVTALAYDATGTLLASGTSVGLVNVWDVRGGYGTHSLRGHTGVVSALLFPRDGARLELFSAGEDGQIRVWDLLASSCRCVLDEHLSVVTGLAQGILDEDRLVSVGRDKVINFWSLKHGKHVHTIPAYQELESVCLFPSRGGKEYVVTGSMRGDLKIWDANESKCVRQHSGQQRAADGGGRDEERPVSRIFIWGDRAEPRLFVAQGTDLYLTDVRTLRNTRLIAGHLDTVIDVKFVTPACDLLAAVCSDELLRVFDPATLSCKAFAGHSGAVLCLAVDAAFRLLATGGKDHAVCLWPYDSSGPLSDEMLQQPPVRCEGHTDGVSALAFPQKSSGWLASGSSDKTLKLWQLLYENNKNNMNNNNNNNNNNLVARCKKTVVAHDKEINAVAFSPNDKLLASASHDKTVKIWSFPELKAVSTLKGHKRAVWNVAFSPVDQVLASASGDMTIRLWSLASGACIKTLEGHGNSVLRVFFVAHGLQLLSSGSDGLLKLWTIKSGECAATFDGHSEKVWALDVSRDESRLASGGSDARINVWENRTAEETRRGEEEEEERMRNEQQLANCVLQRQYGKAIRLALRLEKPRQTLRVFQSMCQGEAEYARLIDGIVPGLEPQALHLLLKYVTSWNTNAKNALITQQIVHSLFTQHTPESLVAVIGKTPLHQMIEGLLPYTQRHYTRACSLIQKSHLIDLILSDLQTYQ